MDKCIKVELPTGHVLLKDMAPANEDSESKCFKFTEDNNCSFIESEYEGWLWLKYDYGFCHQLVKVIAQYGDEFPV